MSGSGYEQLIILNRKIDELLTRYNKLNAELKDLKNTNGSLQNMILERDERIKELEIKYERLKLTGALLGDGEYAVDAKRKLTEIVREIDKCVALLNR